MVFFHSPSPKPQNRVYFFLSNVFLSQHEFSQVTENVETHLPSSFLVLLSLCFSFRQSGVGRLRPSSDVAARRRIWTLRTEPSFLCSQGLPVSTERERWVRPRTWWLVRSGYPKGRRELAKKERPGNWRHCRPQNMGIVMQIITNTVQSEEAVHYNIQRKRR